MNTLTDIQKHRLVTGIVAFLIVLSLFFVTKLINEIKAGEYIGAAGEANTISVSGEGRIFAMPDIATISFTAKGEGKDIGSAQTMQSTLVNKAIAYLKGAGIEEKDIKTVYYNSEPKYEYQNMASCYRDPCPPVKESKIVGYRVNQTVEVKVRNTDKAGEILAGLGDSGVTDLSGPNFSIDDENALKEAARSEAITDAREKAQRLARSLGVRVVRVVGFTENGAGYPMYYAKDAILESSNAGAGIPAPSMPKGENEIISNVSITYEIR